MPIFKTSEPVKNYRASPWKITTLLYYCLRFHYIWPSASILLLEALWFLQKFYMKLVKMGNEIEKKVQLFSLDNAAITLHFSLFSDFSPFLRHTYRLWNFKDGGSLSLKKTIVFAKNHHTRRKSLYIFCDSSSKSVKLWFSKWIFHDTLFLEIQFQPNNNVHTYKCIHLFLQYFAVVNIIRLGPELMSTGPKISISQSSSTRYWSEQTVWGKKNFWKAM